CRDASPKAFDPSRKQYRSYAPAVHDRSHNHGHGSDLDPAVYYLHRPGGLRLCEDPRRVSGSDVRGLAGVSLLEPPQPTREHSPLGFAGVFRLAPAADRRWPCRTEFQSACRTRGCSVRGIDRLSDAHVSGPLVSGRSRSRWPSIRSQRRRLHSGTAAFGVLAAAVVRRTEVHAAAGSAMVCHDNTAGDASTATTTPNRDSQWLHRGSARPVLPHSGL